MFYYAIIAARTIQLNANIHAAITAGFTTIAHKTTTLYSLPVNIN